ncbi:hypothetical protein MMC07_005575 [Pseudocyphellaria aurata]|nr:hypothetical protein [Pseudocyphellaria aurata]
MQPDSLSAIAPPAYVTRVDSLVGGKSQSQLEGQGQIDLVDRSKSKMDLTGDTANRVGLTDEEMESELASIENERRIVMLARRLAAARQEQAGGFPEAGQLPKTVPRGPRNPTLIATKNPRSAREADKSKTEVQPLVPKISTYKEVFRSYKDIRQRSGESVDSLVGRINALEEHMPEQPEQARIHTLLFALHPSAQNIILRRQSNFTTRNELQKLAGELEDFDARQQRRRDHGGRNNGWSGLSSSKGGSHAALGVSKGTSKSPVLGARGVPFHRERRGLDKDLSHIRCYNCERPGHFASNCPIPGRNILGGERAWQTPAL